MGHSPRQVMCGHKTSQQVNGTWQRHQQGAAAAAGLEAGLTWKAPPQSPPEGTPTAT